MPPLGRLVPVPLRQVWAREDSDFTPWLAEAENLSLLAETLNLGPLELQDTEVLVGDFCVDILARDDDGNIVVIENQFELTDHKHLGQILTYIAGQNGRATIIWIAERFREEHRAAIDWLNRNTIEGFNFFAVQVEVLRIGESLPAPRFEVIAKPNDWSRDVARVTRSTNNGPLAKAQAAYWTGFSAFLRDKGAQYSLRAPPARHWCSFGIGRSDFHMSSLVYFTDRKLGVQIVITHRAAKTAYDLLNSERQSIETEFGGPLDWQRMNGQKGCRIGVFQTDMDPNNEAQRPRQYEWLLDQMQRFSRVFRNRIKALSLDDAIDVDPASTSTGPADR